MDTTKTLGHNMNINRIHDDYLDTDKHLWEQEPPESYQVVMDFFSAETEQQCKDRMYKSTNCGAGIAFTESGIVISSIVEGCDFGTASYPLHYADNFTSKNIQDRIDAVEKEAHGILEWANRPCDKNGRWRVNGSTTMANLGVDAPDTSYDFSHFEQGERSC